MPDPTTIVGFVPGQLPPTADITFGALNEPSGPPAWTSIPSWSLIGAKDLVIPPSAQRAIASKSGAKVATLNAGHRGLITDAKPVAVVVERAVAVTR